MPADNKPSGMSPKITQESHAVARKPHDADAAAVLFGLV